MKKIIFILSFFIYCQTIFSQPVAFASLPGYPMGKALCFAYNNTANRIWVCTATKVFYSDNNGALWINTTATGVSSPAAIALTATGTPYIITPQHGMRHYNGTAWIADNNGLPVSPMPQFTSIAIDAAGNVYAGAGWHGLPPNYSGIWKWNGTVWATMNNGLPTVPVSPAPEITSMAIDASGNLFTGTAKILLNGGGQGFGVYKWNGSSWNSFGTGLSNLNVASLAINASGELFAGTFNSIAHIPATSGGAWSNSVIGLPATATTVRSITFDALNNIYAGLGYLAEQAGSLYGSVYISNNNGASWTQSNAIANTTTAINAITTDNAGNIFAAATGIYKSTNQATSWAIDTIGITKNKAKGGYIAINSIGHIYSAGEGGVFKSVDGGINWQMIINGIDRHDLTCIAVDKTDNIYLGGQIWVGGSVRSDSGRVWKSVNGGINWTKANVQDQQISEFKVAANGDVFLAHVFGTTSNMSVTHDGINWVALNIYTPANPNGYGCFSVDVNKRGHIFGTTEAAQVRRSIDGGSTFSSSINLPGGNVQLVRISPHDNIFINGPAPFGTPPLYYSDSVNNGTMFTQSANFPINKSITDIAFDNRDSMYVGTQNGLYTTSLPFNPASSVFSLNASNGPLSVTSFAKDECGFLYTTTYFAGISKSTVAVDNTNTCNVLPIKLIGFSGTYNAGKKVNELLWAIAFENDNVSFEIEKSGDGIHFLSIVKIAGAGNANNTVNYSYADNDPFAGISYYRLKQSDANGRYIYSNIIAIRNLKNGQNEMIIYPNPAQESITVNFTGKAEDLKFQIFSISSGAIVSIEKKKFINSNTLLIPLTNFPTGIYLLRMIDIVSGKTVSEKFEKRE